MSRPGAIKIASTEHEARSKEAGEIAACGVVTPVAPRCDEGVQRAAVQQVAAYVNINSST